MKNAHGLLILVLTSAVTATFACRSTGKAPEPLSSPSSPTEASPSAIPAGQCAYAWATYDLPELSETLELAVQALNPSARARAQAVGEDCVYSDGQNIFNARQTDFHVRLPVTELTNEAAMGDWIMQVMPIVMQLPSESVQGTQPGNVQFTFIKTEAEQVHLTIPIYSYLELSAGKTGLEIFRYYHIPPTSPT